MVKVVFDTGPILHLNEIGLLKILSIYKNIMIPDEVKNELKIKIPERIKTTKLNPKFKDVAQILMDKFDLHMGESQAIALAIQEKADIFFTDDLDARAVGKMHYIETHGTIGIILRAFKLGKIDKKTTIKKINELYTESSLFITKDLVKKVIEAVNKR